MLNDLYDTEFGIFDHFDTYIKKPLATVAMFPSEDINTDSLLEESIRTYVHRGIKDIYGLSLIEFLELPIDIIKMLFEISSEEQSKKNRALADIENQLKK